jgi:hypothetical protein
LIEGLTKVAVSEVRVAVATSPGVEAGMVTLREEDPPHRSFTIIIGQPEARAIQAAMTGLAPRRPSTWDLFVSAVGLLGSRLNRVVISAVEDKRHFFSDLVFDCDGERRVLEARPSDAIALALRAEGAEMYAAHQVLIDLGMGEPPPDN